MNDLAIILVSYNTVDDLTRCLESLTSTPPALTHEIVVVDNASADQSVATVRARFPQVRVIPLDRNAGFAAANNVGIRETESELILLLNSDTVAPPGSLDSLVQRLKTLPGAAVAGPRLVDDRGAAELSFGRMISPMTEWRQKRLTRPNRQPEVERRTSEMQEVDWVSGACLLVRRESALKAGLLDERYFMYCEDVDFCAAIRRHGGRVYFCPEVTVVHRRGRSALSAQSATNAAYRRSQLAFYDKHHPAWAPLLRLYLAVQGKLPPASADTPKE